MKPKHKALDMMKKKGKSTASNGKKCSECGKMSMTSPCNECKEMED